MTATTKTLDAECPFYILSITVKAILQNVIILGTIMLSGIMVITARLNVMVPLHVPQFKTTKCPNINVIKTLVYMKLFSG
jgi:hypothetical protein